MSDTHTHETGTVQNTPPRDSLHAEWDAVQTDTPNRPTDRYKVNAQYATSRLPLSHTSAHRPACHRQAIAAPSHLKAAGMRITVCHTDTNEILQHSTPFSPSPQHTHQTKTIFLTLSTKFAQHHENLTPSSLLRSS